MPEQYAAYRPAVNTHCIVTSGISFWMTDDRASRLRTARMKAGYKSAAAAAEARGWTVSAYRHHENGTRAFGPDAAKKYGRAFKVKPGWLLTIDGIDDGAPSDFEASEKLIVGAPVAAGVWRKPTDDYATMEIDTLPPVSNARRLGFVVEGQSMDLHYAPGTVLDCISIHTNGVEPSEGDHVIVERLKPDGLRELTVKEVSIRDGVFFLVPKSTRSEFKEMRIGTPDADAIDGDEIRVIAFVVGNIPPRSLDLLRRLGKVRDL